MRVSTENAVSLSLSLSLFSLCFFFLSLFRGELNKINPPPSFASCIVTLRGAELIIGSKRELLRAALTTSVCCDRRLLEMGLTAAIIIIPPPTSGSVRTIEF